MATVRKRESGKRDLMAQWVWYADSFLGAADSTLSMLAGQGVVTRNHLAYLPDRSSTPLISSNETKT